MKINNITTSPNFGKVLKAKETFTDTQMELVKDIRNKMNTVYDGHFKGQTPNDWLENRKCDTLVLPGSSDKSVKFLVTSRAKEDPAIRTTVKQYYVVGEYSEINPFYVNDIKEAKKEYNMLDAMLVTIAVFMLAMIGLMINVDKRIAKEKIMQEKEAIVDSLKNVVKNDTIAPLKIK